MRRAIAGAPLAVKKINETTFHKIMAAMIPPPAWGPCGPAACISVARRGTSRHKDDVGDVSAADTGHHFWIRSTGCYLAAVRHHCNRKLLKPPRAPLPDHGAGVNPR